MTENTTSNSGPRKKQLEDLAAAQAKLNALRNPIEQARRSLMRFTMMTFPGYRPDPVHWLIAGALDSVVRGDIQRLMIFAPPQHGKSELASVRLPAYWLGKRPDDPVIITSYGSTLAESKSRQVRGIIETNLEYQAIFPGISTQKDSRAVHRWNIAGHRGGLLAAGASGPLTGNPAVLGLIDDPIENWEAAQSPLLRQKVWEWYQGTFRTRVWENGAIVLIMTRWHEDDLGGRLLQTQGDKWTVLRLPAEAEDQEERDFQNAFLGLPQGQDDPLQRLPGEPLSPRRFSANALAELKDDIGQTAWYAEYQQVPRAPEGNRFKRDYFAKFVTDVPLGAKRVRYWDKAGSESDGACYTAGVLLAQTMEGKTFIEDVVHGRWRPEEREKVIRQTAELDAQAYANRVKIWIEQEPGSAGLESSQATIRNLRGFPIYSERPHGSKDVRMEPFLVQCANDNVYLKRGPWNGRYIEELCAIPNGRYRDQADASSGAFNKLSKRGSSSAGGSARGLYGR